MWSPVSGWWWQFMYKDVLNSIGDKREIARLREGATWGGRRLRFKKLLVEKKQLDGVYYYINCVQYFCYYLVAVVITDRGEYFGEYINFSFEYWTSLLYTNM
jgi:hypothetical protein